LDETIRTRFGATLAAAARCELFALLKTPWPWRFELRHQAITLRFGRYPHRNAILGRESTPEELAFLGEPGSGF
jgi:uncharacterized protein (DUF924 family)